MQSAKITAQQVINIIVEDEHNDMTEKEVLKFSNIVDIIVEEWEYCIEAHKVAEDWEDEDIVLSAFFAQYNSETTGHQTFVNYVLW